MHFPAVAIFVLAHPVAFGQLDKSILNSAPVATIIGKLISKSLMGRSEPTCPRA